MQTFTVLKASIPSTGNAPFGRLNKELQNYIEGDLDLVGLGRLFGGINKQYLALSHLSLNPAVALKRMGCANVDELIAAGRYDCGFLGPSSNRNGLIPLGVVVNEGVPGLRKYDEAFKDGGRDGAYPHLLHLLPDGDRFREDVLKLSKRAECADELDRMAGLPLLYKVNRFEQLFAGSGYTREMLAAGDTCMELQPVGLKLSNGDTLLAYAYKDVSCVV